MPEWLDKIFGIFLVVFFFGFSVFVHELGHLLAAVWRGFHVEKFSIGFGHKIWGFKHRGIDFIVGWLPFGGYVALPQLEPTDEAQTREGQPLPRPKPLDKIIVAVAGPAFNLIFAFLLGFILWKTGKPVSPPVEYISVIDIPSTTVDYKAGLRNDDKIIRINGEKLESTDHLIREYIFSKTIDLEVDRQGEIVKLQPFTPAKIPYLENLAFPPYTLDEKRLPSQAIIQDVSEKHEETGVVLPAKAAGILKGDRVIKVDGKPIKYQDEIGAAINAKKGEKMVITVLRNEKEIDLEIVPQKLESNLIGMKIIQFPEIFATQPGLSAYDAGLRKGDIILSVNNTAVKAFEDFQKILEANKNKTVNFKVKRLNEELEFPVTVYSESYRIGILWQRYRSFTTPLEQFKAIFTENFKTIKGLFSQKVPLQGLSGPVGIGKGIYDQWQYLGFIGVLSFIFMINISLAIFNLLPLPVLDGGHIFVAIAEIVSRRKVPATILQPLTIIFVLLFFSLMIFVTMNDIRRTKDLIKIVDKPSTEIFFQRQT